MLFCVFHGLYPFSLKIIYSISGIHPAALRCCSAMQERSIDVSSRPLLSIPAPQEISGHNGGKHQQHSAVNEEVG